MEVQHPVDRWEEPEKGGWNRQKVWHVGCESDDEESVCFSPDLKENAVKENRSKKSSSKKDFPQKINFQRSYTAALRGVAAVS